MNALAQVLLQIDKIERPFFYRPEGQSDWKVIKQIFQENGGYDLSHFAQTKSLHSFYLSLQGSNKVALIIDAGANIGASAVYFAGLFPNSKLVVIEPEANNCALLRKNCEGLNFSLLEGGIGCVAGTLHLNDPGRGAWGFVLRSVGEHPVRVFAAESIVADQIAQGLVPLMIKIDIEGGEQELFRENTAWVGRFPLLIIELHDWLFPGAATSRNFLRTIATMNFDVLFRGESVFCFNNDLLAPKPE